VDAEVIIAAVLSGLGAGVISSLTTLRLVRRNLEAVYDADLRARRIQHYEYIWRYLRPPPGFAWADVLPKDADDLLKRVQDWYWEGNGGLYMSHQSARCFDEFREALHNLIAGPRATDAHAACAGAAYKLRLSLAGDVGTQNLPLLGRRSASVSRTTSSERATDAGS
jgi:hypothetical protein